MVRKSDQLRNHTHDKCVISGLRGEVAENCALLCYCAASSGNKQKSAVLIPMVRSRFKCESLLYFQSCKRLNGAGPNQKLGPATVHCKICKFLG